MTDRAHLSIGAVLTLLQDEFPDITISKIRFLETQGLLDPERTPSGYRKFYDEDVARLRWILRQQREHFLPLKVIKDRLDEGMTFITVLEDEDGGQQGADGPADGDAVDQLASEPLTARRSLLDEGEPVAVGLDELCRISGLSAKFVAELERYGVLVPTPGASGPLYDGDSIAVARAAGVFRAHGVEARHLRMYKVAAEREAGYFEQLMLPMLMQRSPKARREAVTTLDELFAMGDIVRESLLRQAFREHLTSR